MLGISDFEKAGEILEEWKSGKRDSVTDKELDLIIEVETLVVSFLQALGPRWDLAVMPLRRELIMEWLPARASRAEHKK